MNRSTNVTDLVVSYTANNYPISSSLILNSKDTLYERLYHLDLNIRAKDDKLIRSYIITLSTLSGNVIGEKDVNKLYILVNNLSRDNIKAFNIIDDIYKSVYNKDVADIKSDQLFPNSLLNEFITLTPDNNKVEDASKSAIHLAPLTTNE
jgi:hypothetical protein